MSKDKAKESYTQIADSDAFRVLTPLQKEVVRMRLGLPRGLSSGRQYSVREIARHFDSSPSRIYRILNKSQRKALYFAEKVSKTHRTTEEFKQIAQALEAVKQKKATPEQISAAIKSQFPELTSFVDALPQTRSELYAFITLLLTVIGLIISLASLQKNKDTPNATINQSVTNTIITPQSTNKTDKKKAAKRAKKNRKSKPNRGV